MQTYKVSKNSFQTANYWWVLLSLVLGILSHFSRAYRWQFMLEPMGYKPKFINSCMAVLIAYLVNLGIPRAGEVSRAATLTEYEGVPFEKAFGTIVAERVADVLMLFLFIGLAFLSQFDLIKNILFAKLPKNPLHTALSLCLALLAFYFLSKWMQKSKKGFFCQTEVFSCRTCIGCQKHFDNAQKRGFYLSYFF